MGVIFVCVLTIQSIILLKLLSLYVQAARSVQLRIIACNGINFDSEQLVHLPFMELFSSGEIPSVVAAQRFSCAFSFDVGCG